MVKIGRFNPDPADEEVIPPTAPKVKVKEFNAADMARIFIPIAKPAAPPKSAAPPKPQQGPVRKGKCKATQTTPRFDLLEDNEPIAFDTETQMFKSPGGRYKHRLAWSAATGARGQTLYDVCSRYQDDDPEGTKRMLPRAPGKDFGVTWADLKYYNGAVEGRVVEENFAKLFAGRVVVVHDGRLDRESFQYVNAFGGAARIINTQAMFSHLQFDGTPALATCTRLVLGVTIQAGGNHSPVEDAKYTMELSQVEQPDDQDGEEDQYQAQEEEEALEQLAVQW